MLQASLSILASMQSLNFRIILMLLFTSGFEWKNVIIYFNGGKYIPFTITHFKHSTPHRIPKFKNLTSTKPFLNSLLVLYKFNSQGLSGTTLFISMDYSYNPTSEPLRYLVWLTWWVLHLIISGLNSIPLSLINKYLQLFKSPVKLTIPTHYFIEPTNYWCSANQILRYCCWFYNSQL